MIDLIRSQLFFVIHVLRVMLQGPSQLDSLEFNKRVQLTHPERQPLADQQWCDLEEI